MPTTTGPRLSPARGLRVARRHALVLGALLATASVFAASSARAEEVPLTTYYVDCTGGSDANSGTSEAGAWKTLGKANRATLLPGDQLLLKRGCAWRGPLNAAWIGTEALPITIGAYGSGDLPRVENVGRNVHITGSYLVIDSIHVRAKPDRYDAKCNNWPTGWRIGFLLAPGSAFNVVRDSLASGLYNGVRVEEGSHHNRILDNVLRDNNMVHFQETRTEGGVGVNLMGDDNEVAGNQISGSDSCSRELGRDGSAVEVYGGQRNSIHHNRAWQNHNFSELGNTRSADNTYAYNIVTASLPKGHFLTTRGGGMWGPVLGTRVYNNSVHLTGAKSKAISCGHGCGPHILSLHSNIIWAQGSIGTASGAFDEGNNIYWRSDGRPSIGFPTDPSSRVANPLWVSPAAGDLHLTAGSPAIDTGSTHAAALGYLSDYDGEAVPQGAGVDVGADEYVAPAPAP